MANNGDDSGLRPDELPTIDGEDWTARPPLGWSRVSVQIGERFGGYDIIRLLGKGGMGEVYEADDVESGRRIALKVMSLPLASEDDRERFLREGRLAASINHPNSVYVFGTEEVDGVPVISMELSGEGTLADQIDENGPMTPTDAVDAILQLIAGLEAANEQGVLHRDIKPSNCFVDTDGRVKVGDYGLSISTVAGDTMLTMAGTMLGTPAFSSPEQLKGEDLDIRSDIYSLGATLYMLLTGRPPFEEKGIVRLLAAVLDKTPESPETLRPGIPRKLASVVIRMLERQPAKRFETYTALRKALAPFGSTSSSVAASLPWRVVANFLDNLPIVVLSTVSGFLGGANGDPALALTANDMIVGFLLSLAYFGLLEGIWGATPGKFICGLRVVGSGNTPPGVFKASCREIILSLTEYLQLLLLPFLIFNEGLSMMTVVGASWLVIVFSTAREGNGWAGLHDLATGTRVIRKQRRVIDKRPAPVRLPVERKRDGVGAAHVGPYTILGPLVESDDLTFLAYDPKLRRDVWIRRCPAGSDGVPDQRREVARAGRLRWLNGRRRDEAENWDAYGAVDGKPLCESVGVPSDWEVVRYWILDLAVEARAASRDGTIPESIGIDNVWLGSDGRARLLDFRLGTGGPAKTGIDRVNPSDFAALQRFLHRIAVGALRGELPLAPSETNVPGIPLPLGAFRMLESLQSGAYPNSDEMVSDLSSLVDSSAVLSRGKRLAHVVTGASIPLLTTLIALSFFASGRG